MGEGGIMAAIAAIVPIYNIIDNKFLTLLI